MKVVVMVVAVLGCSGQKTTIARDATIEEDVPDARAPLAADRPAADDTAAIDLVASTSSAEADASAVDAAADMSAAVDASALDTADPAPGPGTMVYVGGFRAEIDVFHLDPTTAALRKIGVVASPPMMPSFMAWRRDGRFGYAVDEVDDGKVVAFTIDQGTGMLTRLDQATVMGFGPTYVALDRTGRWALTASWALQNPASIAVNPIGPDGKVGPPADRRGFPLNAHAHFITTDPTNKYVFASINGEGYVAQYRFDAQTGKLTENDPARVMRAGGPRHMAFAPNGKFAYLINEQGNTVTVYSFDAMTGLLRQLQDISTLPAGFGATNTTAHILVHPSGKFVYGSNRGHDSIVIYGVEQTTGMLKVIGFQLGVGASPRNFDIDRAGKLLLSVGQNDGKLNVFRIDPAAGTLTRVGSSIAVGDKPTYVGIVDVPAP